MVRECGACTLCCTLVPVEELGKKANTDCSDQIRGKGCAVYANRCISCRFWECQWMAKPDETRFIRRPDECHYVIDMMPDVIRMQEPGGPVIELAVVQVWVDPDWPDAHEDEALRAYLLKRYKEENMLALIRYDSGSGFVLVPPVGQHKDWQKLGSSFDRQHKMAPRDKMDALNRLGANPFD